MIVVGFEPSQNAAHRLYRSKPWLRASVSKPKPFLDHLGPSRSACPSGTWFQSVSERWSGSDELPPHLVREIKL
jgi:hypothetical protein